MLKTRLYSWFRGQESRSNSTNDALAFVSQGLALTGDLRTDAQWVRIDGAVVGDVIATSGAVTIGKSGSVTGTVFADSIDLAGHVNGRMIAAAQIACKCSAIFGGHMSATVLSIDVGAQITGTMALHQNDAMPAQPVMHEVTSKQYAAR